MKKNIFIISQVSKSLSSKLNASDWCKEVAIVCNGKGGGKAESAQASGDDVSKLSEAMKRGLLFAGEKLKF